MHHFFHAAAYANLLEISREELFKKISSVTRWRESRESLHFYSCFSYLWSSFGSGKITTLSPAQFPRSVKNLFLFFFTSGIAIVKHFHETESCELLNYVYPTNSKKRTKTVPLTHHKPGRKSKYCSPKHFALNPQQKLLLTKPFGTKICKLWWNTMNAVLHFLFLSTVREYVL